MKLIQPAKKPRVKKSPAQILTEQIVRMLNKIEFPSTKTSRNALFIWLNTPGSVLMVSKVPGKQGCIVLDKHRKPITAFTF